MRNNLDASWMNRNSKLMKKNTENLPQLQTLNRYRTGPFCSKKHSLLSRSVRNYFEENEKATASATVIISQKDKTSPDRIENESVACSHFLSAKPGKPVSQTNQKHQTLKAFSQDAMSIVEITDSQSTFSSNEAQGFEHRKRFGTLPSQTSSDFIISTSNGTPFPRQHLHHVKNTIPAENFERFLNSLPEMDQKKRVLQWQISSDFSEIEDNIDDDFIQSVTTSELARIQNKMREQILCKNISEESTRVSKNLNRFHSSARIRIQSSSQTLTAVPPIVNIKKYRLVNSVQTQNNTADSKTKSTNSISSLENSSEDSNPVRLKNFQNSDRPLKTYGRAHNRPDEQNSSPTFKVPNAPTVGKNSIASSSASKSTNRSEVVKEEFVKYLGLGTRDNGDKQEEARYELKRRSLRVKAQKGQRILNSQNHPLQPVIPNEIPDSVGETDFLSLKRKRRNGAQSMGRNRSLGSSSSQNGLCDEVDYQEKRANIFENEKPQSFTSKSPVDDKVSTSPQTPCNKNVENNSIDESPTGMIKITYIYNNQKNSPPLNVSEEVILPSPDERNTSPVNMLKYTYKKPISYKESPTKSTNSSGHSSPDFKGFDQTLMYSDCFNDVKNIVNTLSIPKKSGSSVTPDRNISNMQSPISNTDSLISIRKNYTKISNDSPNVLVKQLIPSAVLSENEKAKEKSIEPQIKLKKRSHKKRRVLITNGRLLRSNPKNDFQSGKKSFSIKIFNKSKNGNKRLRKTIRDKSQKINEKDSKLQQKPEMLTESNTNNPVQTNETNGYENRPENPSEISRNYKIPESHCCPFSAKNYVELSSTERSEAAIIPNPLDYTSGIVLHAHYEQELLIIIQEFKISVWKYCKIQQLIGSNQEWQLMGDCARKLGDTEIFTQYKNRFCANETIPFYVELRAKSLISNSARVCNMSSVYANIYAYDYFSESLKFCSVQLDSIKGTAKDIMYTAIQNTRYFIMCWKEDSASMQPQRSGICKYSLTPDLTTLASIREFRQMQHVVQQIECLHDQQLIGFGEYQITIWNHMTGDVLKDIELSIPIGMNLASILHTDEYTNYLILYQKTTSAIDGPVLKIFSFNLSLNSNSFRHLYTYDLPTQFDCRRRTASCNGEILVVMSDDGNDEILLLPQQPNRLFYRNRNLRSSDDSNENLQSFYSMECHNFVEISRKSLCVKTINEYIIDFLR